MIKVKSIKKSFKGIQLPNPEFAGTYFEEVIAKTGYPVNKGQGADYPEIGLEIKTKTEESRSSNVIGTMSRKSIIDTPYEQSSIFQKMQQQFRVTTRDGVIVNEELYDFTSPFIQELLKEAYEIGQLKLNVENPPDYINCTKYGYFEKRRNTKDSYMFRISVKAMKDIESISKSTLTKHFKYE